MHRLTSPTAPILRPDSSRKFWLGLLSCCATVVAAPFASAQMGSPAPKSETALKIEKALASPLRSEQERARDARERKPVQTLEFLGLEPNMRVLELLPGAGWYTKILGEVLRDNGKLYISFGASRLAPRLKEWGMDHVEFVDDKSVLGRAPGLPLFQTDSINLPVSDLDMVLTFRNAHNMTPETRQILNRAVFAALKPGGIFGVVDHTRRPNEPTTTANWRRSDPVLIIKEALDAGFEFEAFSNLHYRPDDELRYDTQAPSLAGYSDRFTLKFRTPAR
jgi:predicted methyltransferase